MTQTTFGYDQAEDRLWLRYDLAQPSIWITRRFALGMLGPMAELVERTTTITVLPGVAPAEQIRMEHRLAVQETPQGDSHYPFRLNQEKTEPRRPQGFVLCKLFTIKMESAHSSILFKTDDGEVKFELSRYDTHLWLRAFRMAMDHANWNLPALPAWLTEPLLPPSIQTLLTSPPPADLDTDSDSPPCAP